MDETKNLNNCKMKEKNSVSDTIFYIIKYHLLSLSCASAEINTTDY